MGDCQFFGFPTAGESARLGITMDSDPNFVLGCEAPQGDGPLFFFVPVPGGAVRVPVCAAHGERLTYLYGGQCGTGEQAQIPGAVRPHLLEMLRDGTTAGAVAMEFGVKRWKALAWLAALRDEGVAYLDGAKRGAHWRQATPSGGEGLMGRSVIKQPDGRYAVFSTGTDRWVAVNLTREEYIERCAGLAALEARVEAARLLDDVDAGLAYSGYTFEEANAESVAHGGEDLSGKAAETDA